jgi:NAD(P)-dependent dehydrogenase (short-subunit alcohol dehydrogenase family)
MRLKDKAIIMTGGAGSLGRIFCRCLVEEGAQVLIADLAAGPGQELAEQINEKAGARRVVARQVDVTSEGDAQDMVRCALDSFGKIDILVNNVGVYPHLAFADLTYDVWRKVITINLDSVFLCTKAVLPAMKAQRGGKIINLATNLVWIGLPGMVHYIAAKSGVVGFTRAVAREVGEYNITVNAIAPGAVIPSADLLDDVGLARAEQIVTAQSLKWCQRPIDIVGTLLFLTSSDSDFMTGQILTVDGGLTNH